VGERSAAAATRSQTRASAQNIVLFILAAAAFCGRVGAGLNNAFFVTQACVAYILTCAHLVPSLPLSHAFFSRVQRQTCHSYSSPGAYPSGRTILSNCCLIKAACVKQQTHHQRQTSSSCYPRSMQNLSKHQTACDASCAALRGMAALSRQWRGRASGVGTDRHLNHSLHMASLTGACKFAMRGGQRHAEIKRRAGKQRAWYATKREINARRRGIN